MHIGLRRRYFE